MLERYGRLVYRFRIGFLVFGLLCILAGGLYARGVYGSLTQGGFDVPGSQSQQADRIVNRYFGGNRNSLVVLLSLPTLQVSDAAFRQSATKTLDLIARQPGVTSLQSYFNTGDNRFISHDRHQLFALVGLRGDDDQRAAEADHMRTLDYPAALRVQFGGEAAVNAESTHYVQQDLAKAERYAFPFTALLLIVIFGSLVAAVLPLAVGVYGVIGALVITRLAAYGTSMSVYVLNLISLLGLGLAIDYSLFIVSRFREEMHHRGRQPIDALARTLNTAGRTVIFSALTVLIALAGLIVFPVGFLRSMGIGGVAAVIVALLGALLFLPAILALLGPKIDALSLWGWLPKRGHARASAGGPGNWERISQWVMRWPMVTVIVALGVLLIAGVPFLNIHFVNPDFHILPTGSQARAVGESLAQNFAAPTQTPIQVVLHGSEPPVALQAYTRKIEALPDVASVNPPEFRDGYTLVSVNPRTDTYDVSTKALIAKVRQVPTGAAPATVGGQTADLVDLLALIRHDGIYALVIMLGGMMALFFMMLDSLVIPLKTIVLNVLSLSAAFGALVWIFQEGHLSGLVGITPVEGIDATQPVIIFALAFGLSMDYAVFLFSRVKEHFDEQTDIRRAISWGVQRTGGIITSAALLLLVVIVSFSLGRITIMKEVAIGLIVAVLVDVFVVRLFLVPASMTLLGKHNWWAPRPLKRLYAKFGLREVS